MSVDVLIRILQLMRHRQNTHYSSLPQKTLHFLFYMFSFTN